MTLHTDTDATRQTSGPSLRPHADRGASQTAAARRRAFARRLGRFVMEFLVGALGGPAGIALLERARRERTEP